VEATAEEDAPGPRSGARQRKFRQAAFVYLHVGVLYEAAVYVFWRQGLLPEGRGPVWVWLLAGAVIVTLVFWGLWVKESAWLARIIWALGLLRLPALIEGAFASGTGSAIDPAFYLTALVVVLINLGMLARAGWDL